MVYFTGDKTVKVNERTQKGQNEKSAVFGCPTRKIAGIVLNFGFLGWIVRTINNE